MEEDRLPDPSLPDNVIRPIAPTEYRRNDINTGLYDKVIDVRTFTEHNSARGRLHLSVNIPLLQLLESGPAVEEELSSCDSVLVYCNDGFRSAIAASWAASSPFKFKEVFYLQGGIAALAMVSPASVDSSANGKM